MKQRLGDPEVHESAGGVRAVSRTNISGPPLGSRRVSRIEQPGIVTLAKHLPSRYFDCGASDRERDGEQYDFQHDHACTDFVRGIKKLCLPALIRISRNLGKNNMDNPIA
jgi:hypothetical protein